MDHDLALPARIRALPVVKDEPLHLVRRLAADGCEVQFITAGSGYEHPMHSHDTHNVTVIVSGRFTVAIEEEGKRSVGPGEWYESQPGQMHAIWSEADTIAIELRFAVDQSTE